MDRQDEQIAHDWLITTSANLHNVALGSESCQTLTNSPPTGTAVELTGLDGAVIEDADRGGAACDKVCERGPAAHAALVLASAHRARPGGQGPVRIEPRARSCACARAA